MARGDGFFSVIKKMGEESRQERDDWNKNNPPNQEIKLTQDDEVATIGVWFNKDRSVSFSYKMPNGKYNPYAVIRVPALVAELIKEQDVRYGDE